MAGTQGASLKRILAFDAGWDILLGVLLIALPWTPLVPVALHPWWPAFAVLGGGCLIFGVLLIRAAQGVNSLAICTAAAIGNAVSAGLLIVAVGLLPSLNGKEGGALLLVALVCGGFAFLEWGQIRR